MFKEAPAAAPGLSVPLKDPLKREPLKIFSALKEASRLRRSSAFYCSMSSPHEGPREADALFKRTILLELLRGEKTLNELTESDIG